MIEKIYPKGMFFDRPHENAPDFIKGKVAIKVDEFIEFAKEHKNEAGYINLDLLKSQHGKLYFQLNTFKKEVPEDFKDKSEHMDFNETHRPNWEPPVEDMNKELF